MQRAAFLGGFGRRWREAEWNQSLRGGGKHTERKRHYSVGQGNGIGIGDGIYGTGYILDGMGLG